MRLLRTSEGASFVFTIYCHQHIDSGRRYVGLTKKTWRQRWDQHVCQARRANVSRNHWYNAIRKYGKDAFSHEVLEICHSLEVANLAEESWIELFDSTNPEKGFNLVRGGAHAPHPISSPWDRPGYRERNTASSKAALNTPESRARRSLASKEMWSDPEYRQKISELVKESCSRPEVKLNRSVSQRGKVLSADHRAKISASSRARDPAVRARVSEATKAAMARPEVRAKTVGANIGRKASPETRARIAEAGRGRVFTSEEKKAISDGLRARPRAKKCKLGHLYDGIPRLDGRQVCLTCRRAKDKRSKDRMRARRESKVV